MMPDEWDFLKDILIFIGTVAFAWEGLQTWKRQIQSKTRFPFLQKLEELKDEYESVCRKFIEEKTAWSSRDYGDNKIYNSLFSDLQELHEIYYGMEISDVRFLKKRIEKIISILKFFVGFTLKHEKYVKRVGVRDWIVNESEFSTGELDKGRAEISKIVSETKKRFGDIKPAG